MCYLLKDKPKDNPDRIQVIKLVKSIGVNFQ